MRLKDAVLTPTTIQHEGKTFVKTDAKAKKGDLVRILSDGLDVRKGDVYVLDVDGDGDAYYVDREGDRRWPQAAPDEEYEFYTPQTLDDVITHEGRQYKRVKRKARVGDLFLITGNTCSHGFAIGSVQTALGVFSDGGINRVEDSGYGVVRRDYDVLEPIEKRNANVGERIRIVNAQLACGAYRNGDVLTVTQSSKMSVWANTPSGKEVIVWHDEYVIEPSTTSASDVKASERTLFAKGDKVRLISGGGGDGLHGFTNGNVYTVSDPNKDGGWSDGRLRISGDGVIGYAKFSQLEHVTDDVKKAFVVGDYAKTLTAHRKDVPAGSIVKIIEDDKTELPYKCVLLGVDIKDAKVNEWDWYRPNELERLDAADVEKAQEPQKTRFSVGEFAQVVRDGRGHSYSKGDVVEIIKYDGDDSVMPYWCRRLSDGHEQWVYADDVESIDDPKTPKDATDAEKTQGDAKWAAIGRKKDELREGDIVRCLGSTAGHPVGTIGVLVRDGEYRNLRVQANGVNKSHHGQLELVAPVESVVNLDAIGADTSHW